MIKNVANNVDFDVTNMKAISDATSHSAHLGPVVHSIVSLTTSLRRQFVKYMLTILTNPLLFFVEKM